MTPSTEEVRRIVDDETHPLTKRVSKLDERLTSIEKMANMVRGVGLALTVLAAIVGVAVGLSRLGILNLPSSEEPPTPKVRKERRHG